MSTKSRRTDPMNTFDEEMYAIENDGEVAMHYGRGHLDGGHSGRYPWGSGDDKMQRWESFLDRVKGLESQGWKATPTEIYDKFGMTTNEYKREMSIAKYEQKTALIARARQLSESGESSNGIGKIMGVNESTVRGWLKPNATDKMSEIMTTVDYLRDRVKDKKMVDIGPGTENELGISKDRLETALHYLKSYEDMQILGNTMAQVTNSKNRTIQRILATPEVDQKDTYNLEAIAAIKDYKSTDNPNLSEPFHYPRALDIKRVQIKYNEEGGVERDGLIQIRRGLDDLSLNGALYSQVRILCGEERGADGEIIGTHYLKGMCAYTDDLPDGVDVRFNTNKHIGTPVFGKGDKSVLKKIKEGENPFGTNIKANDDDPSISGQYWYEDKKTGKKMLGLINKKSIQGDWNEWGDALSGQFLSKQSESLIKQQLDLTIKQHNEEYEKISKLTNPVIRKYYLEKFASECDSTANNLRAASLPGQAYHVLLPAPDMPDGTCVCPRLKDGTEVCLVRYPHGGIFEIPRLRVDNSSKTAQQYIKMIGKDSVDAICINHKAAEQLSGADFDGDTAMVIPTSSKVRIRTKNALEGLKDFDGQAQYAKHPGMVVMTKKNMQLEMGKVTNLITDMTMLGASDDEIARAVRHSMVVIDAYKHELDYKQCEKDNDIESLRKKYQVRYDTNGNIVTGGASTIVSRATSIARVPKRQGQPKVNVKGTDHYDPDKPEGALLYKEAPDAHYMKQSINKRTGEIKLTPSVHSIESTKMAEVTNAEDLISYKRHPKELLYADFANNMKAMANKSRLEAYNTPNLVENKEAKVKYAAEVKSLDEKLNTAMLNKTRERHAQRQANAKMNALANEYKAQGEELSAEDRRKKGTRALQEARYEVGSKSRKERNIVITDSEWEAIQAGAISNSKLTRILENSDPNSLRERSMPREQRSLTNAQISKVKAMNGNYTISEIAEATGMSVSSVQKILNGEV